ncbi:MAG: chorismate synthase [Lachnospiraceae bacterium]|nr:chorismate synthase [Lachnospiraceae bacterium]
MKNTMGQSVSLTLFGESHGPYIGAVLDGLAPGISVDEDRIRLQLSLRRPRGSYSTARVEKDSFSIVSGVFEGKTTGTPLTILIPNQNIESRDYAETRALARPGHADYTAYCKYHGFEDHRGGGHFSGRITAALVAAGSVCLQALEMKGVRLGTHIASCGSVQDRSFGDIQTDIDLLSGSREGVLDPSIWTEMEEAINNARREGDSLGGVLETMITGIPAGLGEPWFDTVEGLLAHGIFSIPGIKGVQFGPAFELVKERGSVYNDSFRMEGGAPITETNHNGGINGGITNGMPIHILTAVKPTPSISQPQQTVDFIRGEEAVLFVKGRHDPAIIHRVRVVVDSICALVLCDLLAQRFGTDFLRAT